MGFLLFVGDDTTLGDGNQRPISPHYSTHTRRVRRQRRFWQHVLVSSVQIRVFGPLRVHVDGSERVLSKRRHREIIAILVTLRGRAITTLDLIDELWNGAPPAGAVGAVRTFVGELRRILEPHRLPRTAPAVLVTVSDGYALRLDPDAVDG
jgi:two-component SAPR family response regulator